MPLDQSVLIGSVLVPAAIALLAAIISWRLDRRADMLPSDGSAPGRVLSSLVQATGWWLAVTIGVLSSESLALWPDDGWPKVIWPMLASTLLIAPVWSGSLRTTPGLWIVFASIAAAAGAFAMPVGDGWADMLPLHRTWTTAITIAALSNAFALFSMAHAGAQRWVPLVILAALACPAVSGAASYSALYEACLAAIVATAVIASFAALGLTLASPAILFPSVLFMATMVAASRFRSYDDVPPLAYAIALFAPSLMALADWIVVTKRPLVRVTIAAAAGILIVCITAYQFLAS